MVKTIFVTLAIVAVFYAGLVLLVYFFQRQMIYYPTRYAESDLLKESAQSGLEPWRNARGELIGWVARHPQQPADARIIVFHGNANHAHWCDYYIEAFQSTLQPHRWDVYLMEYPGYASRPGTASEESFVKAATQAIDELKTSDKPLSRPDPKTFLLGESIGAAVASQVAAQRPNDIDGMFFVAPFNNLADLGASLMPIMPVRALLKDRYRSDEALKNYHGPIAFLTAGRDEVVPNRFSQKLFDGYAGPKKMWTQPNASHNTFNFDPAMPFWREAAEFLLEKRAEESADRKR